MTSARCALPVGYMCEVVLAQESYPEELAYRMIGELQQKIYSTYPKVREEESTERLAGARIVMSDICQRYNAMVGAAQEEDPETKQIEAERIREITEKIRGSNIHMNQAEDEKEIKLNVDSPNPESIYTRIKEIVDRNRKAVLILFIVACVVYIITAIVDSAIN
eukprot:TRINITY_DN17176_c0_g1_i7.p2 TRINITY_DN17176_c0_g1~~TRINITY_DN17176_c0_g1_i7.p2  ORF type:complete len:164 (-),score=21.18 TRINITY_DN17176_c0_g1_i7:122-613(-)